CGGGIGLPARADVDLVARAGCAQFCCARIFARILPRANVASDDCPLGDLLTRCYIDYCPYLPSRRLCTCAERTFSCSIFSYSGAVAASFRTTDRQRLDGLGRRDGHGIAALVWNRGKN